MKFQPIFENTNPRKSFIPFANHISKNTNQNQNSTYYTIAMPSKATWFKIGMLVVIESLFQWGEIIAEAIIDQV